jgi:uncharacterized DUF497 family protein
VQIEWDRPKRLTNLLEHPGMDFADLDLEFFEAATLVPAKQGRLMAIGHLRSRLISVVFLPLGTEGVSIISMRAASKKERKRYYDNQA